MKISVLIVLALGMLACSKQADSPETLVLGHAGESIYNARNKFPPNHLLSALYAVQGEGAQGVELDVQLTSDSVLVLYHDLTLDKNSTLSGCINSLTWSEVKEAEIYNSDYNVSKLEDVFNQLGGNTHLFLDVKQWNECTQEFIDYGAFDDALNQLLAEFSPFQKSQITVNCRDIDLFSELSDPDINRSFESDEVATAGPLIDAYNIDFLTIKLSAMESNDLSILNPTTKLVIYNIKTRSDVTKALEYTPDFVISDNISYTLKAING